MTIFLISDLHLSPENDYNYGLFTNFINNLPQHTKAIYILGDFWEYWIDDNFNNKYLTKIKHLLQKTANKIPIFFIHGNRDFLIGQQFAKETQIQILPQFYKVNLYNYNILLTHGDYLITDFKYYCFRKIIRHNIITNITNKLPLNFKLNMANILRHFSKKNNTITDVCPKLIDKYLKLYNSNFLIHGHTHQPNIYKNNHHTRVVLGAWEKTAKILILTEQEYKLEEIS